MATSGAFETNFSPGFTLRVEWAESNVDTANNCSDITAIAYLIAAAQSNIYSSAAKSISLTINGSTYSGTCTVGITAGQKKELFRATLADIAHTSDGSKSVSISCTLGIQVTLSGTYISSVTKSGTATLTKIARKSTLSISNTNRTLGVEQTLTINRNASSFTHTLTYTCGSASGTIATKTTGTSIKFTPPLSLAAQNTKGTKVSIYYTLTTYSGSTAIGTHKPSAVSYTIPASVAPSLTESDITVTDAEGYSDTYGNPVKGLSRLSISVSPTMAQGSAITAYDITANGARYNAASVTTDALKTAGDNTINATVTDGRGRTASASKSVTVLDYAAPAITKLSVGRCNADGTANDQGEYTKVAFNSLVTSLSNKNNAAYKLKYKKAAAETFTEQSISIDSGEDKYNLTNKALIFAAESGSAYNVVVEVTDNFNTTARSTAVSTAFSLMHWNAAGNGIAFGKLSEKQTAVEFGMDMYDKSGLIIGNGLASYTGSGDAAIDPDTTLDHLILTNKNTPTTAFHYVQTFFYVSKEDASNKAQIAIPYSATGSIYHRFKTGGVWSEWRRVVNSDEAAEYIVEQGGNDDWTWRKYSSGLCEIWGYFRHENVAVTNAQGNGFYSVAVSTPTFPFEIIAGSLNMSITAANAGTWFTTTNGGSATTFLSYRINRWQSGTVSVTGAVQIKARWK